MASSKRTFRMFVEEELGIFPHFLLWAVLEWMLIVSLYLDGFFTFISNKFADTFELDPPCVLCTRVDHALCGKNPNLYYNDSICDSHKKDISSLAYCHVHRKLSDIRTMCESCLLSFAIENNSDSDNNIERDVDDRKPPENKVKNVNNKPERPRAYDPNLCSCCGESLKPKQPTKEYSTSLSSLRALPASSPRASALFLSSTPRAFSTLGPMASPRASSGLMPGSSPRAFSLLFPTSSPRAFSSLAPMCSPRAFSQNRYSEFKFANDNEPDLPEDYSMNMKHSEEMIEDLSKTFKSNKFFGIPLTEVVASPRWAVKPPKKAAPSDKDKTDSALETNEDDEYSLIQQLKKQVSDNRKTLVTLYMELDEERSAATVAANNAMAMITRLQAEKAGVHMEALQYQRMMDEQAEYDEEAIQILKDLLLKKEEDAKVLEAELDVYRARYGEIKKHDSDEYDEYYDDLQPRLFGDKYESWSIADDHNVDDKMECRGESSVDFETERCQLFGMLKDIEDNIHSSSQEDQNQDDNKGDGDNATLRREVNQLREKLAAIEAESGFLKHTAMALEKGDEGTKLLTEIAEHLRKLQS